MAKTQTMKSKSIFSFLVAVLTFAMLVPAASAFVDINNLYVNGIDHYGSNTIAGVEAGENVAVRVNFEGLELVNDVRVVAKISGESSLSVVTERFVVLQGSTYSKLLNIQLPYGIDPNERHLLEISIEAPGRQSVTELVQFEVQRASYDLQILSADLTESVKAGENLVADIVLKNRGYEFAEDSYLVVIVPQLGISKRLYVGDLAPLDQGGIVPDKEDAVAGRIHLPIPRNAPAGVYDVRIEAYSDDASDVMTKRVVIASGSADSQVVSSVTAKTFAAGQEQIYTMTIVNADSKIRIYDLVLETPNGLTVTLDESVIAVPAGTSKTVTLRAVASERGTYNFAVNVHDGELVKKQSFTANVEGKAIGGGSAAVVLTIILAIIFVVLLVVLIVLLTRKPQKSDEMGESYY